MAPCLLFKEGLQKLSMPIYGLLNPLGFDANIPLRGGGAAVLQEPLDKDNIIAVVLIHPRSAPLCHPFLPKHPSVRSTEYRHSKKHSPGGGAARGGAFSAEVD